MKRLVFVLGIVLSFNSFAKTVSVSVNPLAMGLGLTQLNLDIAIGDNLVIGGSLIDVDISGDVTLGVSQYGSGAAGRIGYYFSEALEDSWYISSEFGTMETDIIVTSFFDGSEIGTGGAEYTYYNILLGYHWQWGFFNINWGLGYYSFESTVTVDSGTLDEDDIYNNDGFGGDLRVGFAF